MTEKQETSAHLDAQLGVIGSLLLDADKCAGEVFLRTREEQYTGEYKTLFAAAKRLYQEGRPIDPVTVRGIAGEEYTNLILQIMELTPTAANCGAYLDLLVEQAQVSKMQTLGLALASCKSTEEAKHLIEEANQVIVQRAGTSGGLCRTGALGVPSPAGRKSVLYPLGIPQTGRNSFVHTGRPGDLGRASKRRENGALPPNGVGTGQDTKSRVFLF